MEQGIILISISDDTKEEDMKGKIPNPYRTGGWCVVKQSFVERVMKPDDPMLDFMRRHRFAFITDQAWDFLGLPREEVKLNDSTTESGGDAKEE
jgi:hypothetical protein